MAATAETEQFSENATTYLTDKNFKTLMEYLSAEVLFKRPEDPIAFLKAVLGNKLKERGLARYTAGDPERYLKHVYENPAPEGEAAAKVDDVDVEESSALRERVDKLEKVVHASRAIAQELDPIKATGIIISECCSFLGADRATMFKLDETGKYLDLMVAEGASGIRVPVGTGIAGTVAKAGRAENITDAYLDSRFDPSFDKKSGYKTVSVLAVPVLDGRGDIVGVLQAINKLGASGPIPFTDSDAEHAGFLAHQAGIALRNADLYRSSVSSQEKVRALIEVVKSMQDNLGINSLMFTITQRAPSLVNADRATFFLANHNAHELWAMQGDVDIRIPIDKGIAGAVATSGKMINIADAYEDSRFNKDVDKSSGYRTRQILCLPLMRAVGARAGAGGDDSPVVGVLQLINKRDSNSPFDDEDMDMVKTFLSLIAPIIESSQLYQNRTGKKKAEESGSEFSGGDVLSHSHPAAHAPSAPVIEEGDEDEEEEDSDEE